MNLQKLGTVWVAKAKIQRISEDFKWETLAVCVDTPNEIRKETAKLQDKGYKAGDLWVVGDATERKMVSDL